MDAVLSSTDQAELRQTKQVLLKRTIVEVFLLTDDDFARAKRCTLLIYKEASSVCRRYLKPCKEWNSTTLFLKNSEEKMNKRTFTERFSCKHGHVFYYIFTLFLKNNIEEYWIRTKHFKGQTQNVHNVEPQETGKRRRFPRI